MFSQFFGNFILNNKLVTPSQLADALEVKSSTRLKLGVLAINAGLMTSSQVEEVHSMQSRVDKRFGDIAVDLGFVTEEQINSLLSTQKTGYLILGQALVDKGYLTNSQFEQALSDYKEKFKLSDDDFTSEKQDKLDNIISEFYHFDTISNAKKFTQYVHLLFKNLIRFIGDDFTPLEATIINNYNCNYLVAQNLLGDFSAFTAIEVNKDTLLSFATRFSKEPLFGVDEFTLATYGEFLNLHNGLFTVNMSNENNIELELTPQDNFEDFTLSFDSSAFCIPFSFPFGIVNIILANKN